MTLQSKPARTPARRLLYSYVNMADKRENCEAREGNSYSDPNETDDVEVEGRPQEK